MEAKELKDAHDHACELVAKMHAAAVGEVTGPKRGVVEDIEDLKTERDQLHLALKPFAQLWSYHDLEDDVVVFLDNGKHITAGDVRLAQHVWKR